MASRSRRALLRRVVTEGAPLETLLADEDLMEGFVGATVHGVWHASCCCRMGRPDDPDAVVDPRGRVIGVKGLRIVGASVMPSIPSANTNLPTIMIAERMSDAILADAVQERQPGSRHAPLPEGPLPSHSALNAST